MTSSTKRLFDRHFAGKDNAGVRKQIRDAADGAMPACGPVVERAVLSLAGTIALTASGKSNLIAAAADYRAARKDWEPRCECDSCTAAGRQLLGANG